MHYLNLICHQTICFCSLNIGMIVYDDINEGCELFLITEWANNHA